MWTIDSSLWGGWGGGKLWGKKVIKYSIEMYKELLIRKMII